MSRCGGFLGAFDEVTVLEAGAGPDEGDEVGCGDRTPAGLGGLDNRSLTRGALTSTGPAAADRYTPTLDWLGR